MLDRVRWPHADRLLDEALTEPPAERRAWVQQHVADPELARVLEAVLAEAEAGDPFLAPAGALSGSLFQDFCRTLGDEDDRVLPEGTLVGPYRIVSRLGRGGMGEVYRAQDTRLHRDVALKLLHPDVAAAPDRLARVEQEARALAALNHPRIAAIYDLEESTTPAVLVLELVEGPTLADRVKKGRLPIGEALRLAREIVEALEAAHVRGIVHCDLKPSNIKLTRDGGIKVLDFGLARAVRTRDPDTGGLGPDTMADTLAGQAAGVVVGTVPYMSPEQLRGRRVDHRTDIWAFGCVLFEMLTGRPAFAGTEAPDVVARVLESQPALAALPPATPLAIRRLLRRCLEKDPRRRLGYIGDAALEIDDALAERQEAGEAASTPGRGRSWWPWRLAGVGLLAGGLLAVVLAWATGWRVGYIDQPSVTRLAVPLAAEDELVIGQTPGVALSPDGRTIVYRARRGGVMRLYRRRLDDEAGTPIPGTEDGTSPFFSPDGQWLGFEAEGVLKRVRLAGGPVLSIGATPGGVSAIWTSDDRIIYAAGSAGPLFSIRPSGGSPVALTRPDDGQGDLGHGFPEALPDGRHVVMTVMTREGSRLAVVALDGGAVRDLGPGRQARSMSGGLLVFMRQGGLWGMAVDRRGAPVSDAVPLGVQVEEASGGGAAHFAVAASGSLIYVAPREAAAARQLVWADRTGREERTDLAPGPYTRASLSPDGARIALAVGDPANHDIWVYDVERRILTRLTFDDAVDTAPVWTPDGRSVVFRSEREGGGMFRAAADGAGRVDRLTSSSGRYHTPYAFTPDGATLLFSELRSYRDQGIGALAVDEDGDVRWLFDGPGASLRPHLSPDGQWLAYQSDESGRFEIYVRPWPDVDRERWQVSVTGGTTPIWRRQGRELFYYDGQAMMVVRLRRGAGFSAAPPEPLFRVALHSERLGPYYDVSADGQRFLFIREAPANMQPQRPASLLLVEHWAEEVRRLVSTGGR